MPVPSLAQAGEVASAALTASGTDADGHLRLDLRPDRAELSLQTRALGEVTGRDTQLARRISGAVAGLGLVPAGATSAESPRPVQMLEMAIDALDIPAIRPFWKAVMAYADEPGHSGPEDAIVDPAGQGPAIWFQQMDAPRPQRNRVHFDITVPDDEADARVRAALGAGGRLVDDSFARVVLGPRRRRGQRGLRLHLDRPRRAGRTGPVAPYPAARACRRTGLSPRHPASAPAWAYPGLVRLVSLLPSATEIVYSLGLGEDLVGVTFECDEPPAARSEKTIVVGGRDTRGMTAREIDSYVRAQLAAGRGPVHAARPRARGSAARPDPDPGPVPGVRAAVRAGRRRPGLPGMPGRRAVA